ncbi:MAG: SRPBCC family protein [Sphingopyxis sp.]
MSTSDIRTVVVEREIAHPPEKLWRALTRPHLIAEWLMANDFLPDVGHRFQLRGASGAGCSIARCSRSSRARRSHTLGITPVPMRRSTSKAW